MARIRTIKPDFFKSEDVSALPMRARLTWIGLWTQCDDHGRYKDSARLIKGDLWSLEDVSLRDIEDDLAALAEAGRIVRYAVEGKPYLAIVNWHAHQAINRPSKPKHPGPPRPLGTTDPEDDNHCKECAKPGKGSLTEPAVTAHGAHTEPSVSPDPVDNTPTADQGTESSADSQFSEPSVSTHGALTEGSRQEGKGKERKGREDARASNAANPPPAPVEAEEPPSRCPKHLTHEDPPPCAPCGEARKAHEAWQRQAAADRMRAVAMARSSDARQRAALNRAAIDRCTRCDTNGHVDGMPCAHDPAKQQRARTGAALARAALAKDGPP